MKPINSEARNIAADFFCADGKRDILINMRGGQRESVIDSDMRIMAPSVEKDYCGPIDFDFYDKRARRLRSEAIASALKFIIQIFSREQQQEA